MIVDMLAHIAKAFHGTASLEVSNGRWRVLVNTALTAEIQVSPGSARLTDWQCHPPHNAGWRCFGIIGPGEPEGEETGEAGIVCALRCIATAMGWREPLSGGAP